MLSTNNHIFNYQNILNSTISSNYFLFCYFFCSYEHLYLHYYSLHYHISHRLIEVQYIFTFVPSCLYIFHAVCQLQLYTQSVPPALHRIQANWYLCANNCWDIANILNKTWQNTNTCLVCNWTKYAACN